MVSTQVGYRPYDNYYASLHPPSGTGHVFRDTRAEWGQLNLVVKIHQRSARIACEKLETSGGSDGKGHLLLREPHSLVAIYCDIMEKNFDDVPYVPIVKDFHKTIGYSGFLHGEREKIRSDREYGTGMLIMKDVANSIRQGKRPDISPFVLYDSLKNTIYYLIKERFYGKCHTIFGSLSNMLSSLHTIMDHVFKESSSFSNRDAAKIHHAESLMLQRLFFTKAAIEKSEIRKNARSWDFNPDRELPASLLVRCLQPHLNLLGAGGLCDSVIIIASERARMFVTSIYIQTVFLGIKLSDDSTALDMYRHMLNSVLDPNFITWNSRPLEEKELARFYEEKSSSMWTRFSRRKDHLDETEKWDWRQHKAAGALQHALEWARTPIDEGDALAHPAQIFAKHAVTLKIRLLEAHAGKPIKISSQNLDPGAVNEALSKKS
ncbi:hypothetical protein BJ684DRAFT_18796 [Piptocephalis cylindrospora]|uniref:Uncharacterized protein n=1 Tax=Piptocephalis cylindrospora TaxID=1907219 RepID=A0A4V1IYK0_9FUNG|nr:hypothetical protein BJ684DRAFT_18796 [Piptocephalis cylindrospora]|eukprot:RKP14829.1 hypothetical protein BJ684DRAFT_18796 [Piptocephalis cylindrospora]